MVVNTSTLTPTHSGRLIDFPGYEFMANGQILYKGEIVNQRVNDKGYLDALFNTVYGKKRFQTHRLILLSHSKPGNYKNLHCDHINDIKRDNRLCNLQWLTPSQNRRKFFKNGGAMRFKRRLCINDAIGIKSMHLNGKTNAHIARMYGTTYKNVSMIVNGHRWKHANPNTMQLSLFNK